jgi:hypothetical protein
MHYISFDPLGFFLLRSAVREIANRPHAYSPQIGLDFYSHYPRLDITQPRDITREIARGQYDRKIRELARLFKGMAVPVFLRPGFEFGGNGYGRHAAKQYWVEAWKRIHALFRSEGASNVAFVWNTLDAADYQDYYPGDEYVDWWAINVFDDNADVHPFINAFIADAGIHGKPVMIAEATPRHVGSTRGEESWHEWYEPFFRLLARHRHIKAFCYINASWKDYPDKSFGQDCRIQKDAYVASQYRLVLNRALSLIPTVER